MISYIKGTVQEVFEREVLVTANNVGYLIMVGNRVLSKAKAGGGIELFIYPKITRDGDVEFFGVADKEELNIFKKLISVSGVGPKMAMNIVSGSSVKEIVEAIEKERVEVFLKTSGVGKKTAQKIILDLKGQIQFGASGQDDLSQALVSLGYSRGEIESMMRGVDSSLPLEGRIKQALRSKGK